MHTAIEFFKSQALISCEFKQIYSSTILHTVLLSRAQNGEMAELVEGAPLLREYGV